MKAIILALAIVLTPTAAHADGPDVQVTADCTGFTVTTSGLPPDAPNVEGVLTHQVGVIVGRNGEPPMFGVANGSAYFAWTDSHPDVNYNPTQYWVVFLSFADPNIQYPATVGQIDCPSVPVPVSTDPVAIGIGDLPPTIAAPVVDISTPVAPEIDLSPWAAVEDAPPW